MCLCGGNRCEGFYVRVSSQEMVVNFAVTICGITSLIAI